MRIVILLGFGLLVGCRTAPVVPEVNAPVASSSCICEDGCLSACESDEDATTSYRKVERDPTVSESVDTEPPEAFDIADVRASEPLVEPDLSKVLQTLPKKPDDVLVAFAGDFVRGRGTEHAIVSRSGELMIFKDGDLLARLKLGSLATDDPVEVVQLVDGRLEVVVRSVADGVERLTVCRVIGRAVARVFEIETRQKTVEFVHLGEERAIRVRQPNRVDVYRWNPWEGMFRIPSRAPTAPPQ